jgi:hypothetical protein
MGSEIVHGNGVYGWDYFFLLTSLNITGAVVIKMMPNTINSNLLFRSKPYWFKKNL